jgi:hypothetical protein
MDFANAALLVAAVFGVTELVKALLPQVNVSTRLTVIVALAASIGMVFLVGATVWAHTQVIGGHPLDSLGVGDKFVVALFLAGAQTGLFFGLQAVKNIGENQPQKPIAK